MRFIYILALCISLSACQVSGSSNGRTSNANIFANILTLEF